MRTYLLPGFLVVCLLSGCASLSKDECLAADWQLIGYEDGLKGRAASRVGKHREACAGYGVTPDAEAYRVGYEEGIYAYCSEGLGLRSGQKGQERLAVCPADSEYHDGYALGLEDYCSFNRGYQEGLKGRSYRHVCPGSREDEFLAGYEQGNHIYQLNSTAQRLAEELDEVVELQLENERTLDYIRHHLAHSDNLSREQRYDLERQLAFHRNIRRELRRRHLTLELDLTRIEAELRGLYR